MRKIALIWVALALLVSAGMVGAGAIYKDWFVLATGVFNVWVLCSILERILSTRKPCSEQWVTDCRNWYGRVLTGWYAHWCSDWDELPIDWTRGEFVCCTCFNSPFARLLRAIRRLRENWREYPLLRERKP